MSRRPPFIVLSLPRSRSAWITAFLSYGGRKCGHDLATQCESVADFAAMLRGEYAGTAETGAVVGWRAIRALMPEAKIAVVRRPVQEVHNSLARFGLGGKLLMDELRERDAMLEQVAAVPGVRSFTFDDLEGINACQQLFEHCLGEPFEWEWWESLANVNVQVDVRDRLKYLVDNKTKIDALKADAARIARAGIVIGPERWDSIWPEVDSLGAAHYGEVCARSEPNRPYKLDAAAMRAMNEARTLLIFTARVDGVLAGYCMWTLANDVESAGLLIAQHGPWFVKEEFKGLNLGAKLFDLSIDELRLIGVKCVFPHHRLEGRSAKVGAFYRRRGAVEIQRTYSMWLGELQHA